MTRDEVVQRLSPLNRAQVSRDTGLHYQWLCDVVKGRIKEPGSEKFDKLRAYLLALDIMRGRPQ